ncbi:MAG: CbiX/SirB N-terminal domain-containing protein [Pseudomonadota bacterium]
MTRALVLFAHGARASSWAVPFERLTAQAQARMPDVPVSLAFLELMEPRLPAHLGALAAQGVTDVTVVPVFLGQGGHLLRDLPEMVAEVRSAHPQLAVRVAGAVGEDPAVQQAMTDYCVGAFLKP